MADKHFTFDENIFICNTPKGFVVNVQKTPPFTYQLDFTKGALGWRLQEQQGKNCALAKAIGINKKKCLNVLDITAGFCKDAFIMAKLGCQVIALEQHPFIFAITQEALKRAMTNKKTQETAGKIKLVRQEALHYLKLLENTNLPDVIYVDPMFPARKKSAKVKKDMQLLQLLTPAQSTENCLTLLNAARAVAESRVVVKRPTTAHPLLEPSHQIKDANIRFDVYTKVSL